MADHWGHGYDGVTNPAKWKLRQWLTGAAYGASAGYTLWNNTRTPDAGWTNLDNHVSNPGRYDDGTSTFLPLPVSAAKDAIEKTARSITLTTTKKKESNISTMSGGDQTYFRLPTRTAGKWHKRRDHRALRTLLDTYHFDMMQDDGVTPAAQYPVMEFQPGQAGNQLLGFGHGITTNPASRIFLHDINARTDADFQSTFPMHLYSLSDGVQGTNTTGPTFRTFALLTQNGINQTADWRYPTSHCQNMYMHMRDHNKVAFSMGDNAIHNWIDIKLLLKGVNKYDTVYDIKVIKFTKAYMSPDYLDTRTTEEKYEYQTEWLKIARKLTTNPLLRDTVPLADDNGRKPTRWYKTVASKKLLLPATPTTENNVKSVEMRLKLKIDRCYNFKWKTTQAVAEASDTTQAVAVALADNIPNTSTDPATTTSAQTVPHPLARYYLLITAYNPVTMYMDPTNTSGIFQISNADNDPKRINGAALSSAQGTQLSSTYTNCQAAILDYIPSYDILVRSSWTMFKN